MGNLKIVEYMDDSVYLFLAANFLWGLYCIVIVWQRIKTLRFRNDQQMDEFLGQVNEYLRRGDLNSLEQLCQDDVRALPKMTMLAVQNRNLEVDQLRQLLGEVVHRDVVSSLEFKIGWVATVIKSGPLLGLFGTVLGMMAAFGRIGTGEDVKPETIAEDISIALICTAAGLATAIPFTFLLSTMNIRLRLLQETLGYGLSRLVEFLHGARA